MDHAGIHHLGTDATTHDLVAIAAGFGVAATRSTSLAELEEQLSAALAAERPAVIEFAVSGA